MKLSCQEGLAQAKNFGDALERLERYGFDGIELNGNALHDPAQFAERRRLLKSSKVRPSSICGGFDCELVHADPKRRQTCVDAIKKFLDFSAELGAAGPIFVPIFNANTRVPDLSPLKTQHQLEIELLTEVLRGLAQHAQSVKATLLLEPLNRYESNALANVAEGAKVCRAVGGVHIRVMADFFHMNIEEFNTAKAFQELGDMLGHVHLADNTRKEPGSGQINFKESFAALKKSKFAGYMAFECGLTDSAEVALPRAVKFLRQCIAEC